MTGDLNFLSDLPGVSTAAKPDTTKDTQSPQTTKSKRSRSRATAADKAKTPDESPEALEAPPEAATDASEAENTVASPPAIAEVVAEQPDTEQVHEQAPAAVGDFYPSAIADIDQSERDNTDDQFLGQLSPVTRNSLWEMGLTSLARLSNCSRADLVAPRGLLTPAQADELASKLATGGTHLRASAHDTGSRGADPVGGAAKVKHEDADLRRRREARLMNERRKRRT